MFLLAAALACHAVDGDTLRCGRERIRLVGIDAPEMRGRCQSETMRANRARDRLAELIAGGFHIQRTGTDRYRRTLARVTVNGRDVGAVMVQEGLARRWDGKRHPWC